MQTADHITSRAANPWKGDGQPARIDKGSQLTGIEFELETILRWEDDGGLIIQTAEEMTQVRFKTGSVNSL